MKYFLSSMVLCVLLMGCGPKADISDNTLVYETAKTLKPFKLQDQNGDAVTQKALENQWNLLFLGYTSCPDICPLTLAKLSQVASKLKDKVALQVWFISVDPARDTAQRRKEYVDYFSPDFIAATAEHKVLFPFVRDMGLIYAISEGEGEDYRVDHSASVALVDPEGRLRAIFKPEFAPGQPPTINTAQLIKEIPLLVEGG